MFRVSSCQMLNETPKPRGSCQVSKTKPDVSLCRFKAGEDLRLVSTSASLFMRLTLFSSFQQFLMGNPATSFSVSASVHDIHDIRWPSDSQIDAELIELQGEAASITLNRNAVHGGARLGNH